MRYKLDKIERFPASHEDVYVIDNYNSGTWIGTLDGMFFENSNREIVQIKGTVGTKIVSATLIGGSLWASFSDQKIGFGLHIINTTDKTCRTLLADKDEVDLPLFTHIAANISIQPIVYLFTEDGKIYFMAWDSVEKRTQRAIPLGIQVDRLNDQYTEIIDVLHNEYFEDTEFEDYIRYPTKKVKEFLDSLINIYKFYHVGNYSESNEAVTPELTNCNGT
jgi:hypothetical protein